MIERIESPLGWAGVRGDVRVGDWRTLGEIAVAASPIVLWLHDEVVHVAARMVLVPSQMLYHVLRFLI